MISCSKGDLSIGCIKSLGWVKGEDTEEVLHLSCVLLKRALYRLQIEIYKKNRLYDVGISEDKLLNNCKVIGINVEANILQYLDIECYISDTPYNIQLRVKEGLELYKKIKEEF